MWSFTTANTPSLDGQWGQPLNMPIVAINTILTHTGQVLMWDGGPDCIGSPSAKLWDPSTGTFTPVPVDTRGDTNDIFCAGEAALADGRILVVGGHDCSGVNLGLPRVNIFDPVTQQWTAVPDMAYGRWYPTATTLPDGKVLVTSGATKNEADYVPIPEMYDPTTNSWSQVTSANFTIPSYPFMYVLPDGRVLDAGSTEFDIPTHLSSPTMALDPLTLTWHTVDANLINGGSSVMYQPGKIMKSGSSYQETGNTADPATNTTFVLDTTGSSPAYRQSAPMAYARAFQNLTILPNGQVLATGGESAIDGVQLNRAVYPSEIWNPATQTWTTVAGVQIPRLYHSTALLLPDGRVMVTGGGRDFGLEQANELNMEIYSPSYLFQGARPTITSAPGSATYGSSFFVQTPDAANITTVTLVRPGSVTHAFNSDQRFLNLAFQQTAGGITVQAPADANLAPPGYYMLFINNSQGVPSVASFINCNRSPQITEVRRSCARSDFVT